ncbi:hypothetical protein AK812_SmicGene45696 [Symbiodinium microadriaticum]|uniref:Uncharacterized protein n=1 Tax=Symbiodinium microadriaticum TaxID=2951 RepID=A0A1Q9BVL5_SYMMI|nr:hypothetical protein AK812_SmicGene45696 [Symbiodinium microadriaticum]
MPMRWLISQITAFPNARLLTGDLDQDFRESLAKHWSPSSDGDLAAPGGFRSSPQRRLIPDALALMQLDKRDAILAGQRRGWEVVPGALDRKYC